MLAACACSAAALGSAASFIACCCECLRLHFLWWRVNQEGYWNDSPQCRQLFELLAEPVLLTLNIFFVEACTPEAWRVVLPPPPPPPPPPHFLWWRVNQEGYSNDSPQC